MRSVTTLSPLLWFSALVSALGVVAISVKAFESEQDKAKRAELRRQRERRALADKVSAYGRAVHKQFPSGEVVISERDLAEQLRKRTDMIVSALNLLLRERKVQQTPLSGYWKLNA